MFKFWKIGQQDNQTPKKAPQPTPISFKLSGTTELFPGLSENDVAELLPAFKAINTRVGGKLFTADDLNDRLFIIDTGQVQLERHGQKQPHQYGPGTWFSDINFFNPEPRQASAQITEAGQILSLEAEAFHELPLALQFYFTQRLQQLASSELMEFREQQAVIAQLNRELIDTLYLARTKHGVGFATTPVVKQIFSKVTALPVASLSLLNKVLDPETNQEEIVELVSTDPALTATLLRAVNSPIYGFQSKISSVSHAIVLLGHNNVYQIVLGESLRHSLPDTPLFASIHYRTIEISRFAFHIAQVLNATNPSEAATLGLLNDVGLIVSELLKTYNPSLSLLFDFIESGELAAELLKGWKIPSSICESLRYRSYPEFALPEKIPEEVRSRVAVLYLARRLHLRIHRPENELPALFTQDYINVVSHNTLTEDQLLHDHILPRLNAQRQFMPRGMVIALEKMDKLKNLNEPKRPTRRLKSK
jgi:HD-like signal output (HDOD) protein/CRP-like cAMP-binding protein